MAGLTPGHDQSALSNIHLDSTKNSADNSLQGRAHACQRREARFNTGEKLNENDAT
jgi:hypothetical protein